MGRNAVILGIVIVALVVGSFLLFTKKAAAPKTETTVLTPQKDSVQTDNSNGSSLSSQSTVTYDGNGFSPNQITVKKGTTVTFTSTNGNFWVASDPHPTHTDYPGFDEKSSGTSYSFTFDKIGNWGYHNHLNHDQTGRVIVTE